MGGKRLTTKSFKERAFKKHGNKYNYDDVEIITGITDKVNIFCNKHQKYFPQSPHNHLQGQGCPDCAHEAVGRGRRRSARTKEKFIKLANKVFPGRFNYDQADYINTKTKIKIYCIEHKEYFHQNPEGHLKGNLGCPKCKEADIRRRAENHRSTTEVFAEKGQAIYGDHFSYHCTAYKSAKEKVEIFCNIHKESFWQTPANHLTGYVGCEKCYKDGQNRCLASNKEEFAAKSKIIHGPDHYNYDDVVYITARLEVQIYCNIHKEYFPQTPDSHLRGHGCPKCGFEKIGLGRLLPEEDFLEEIEKIHGKRYDYSEMGYVNRGTPIKIICSEHGPFTQTPNGHLNGHGCWLCGIEKRAEEYSISEEEFLELATNKYGNHFDYSNIDYVNYQTKINVYCNIHKIYFEQFPGRHLHGDGGCLLCQADRLREAFAFTLDEFKEISNKIHDFKYDYSEVNYINEGTKVIIICPKHGRFPQSPHIHIRGCGCPNCGSRVSKPETEWLNSLNIPDDKEHRQVTLRINGRRFHVDGFDLNTNTIYEFYGDYYHGNPNSKFKADEINKITHCTFGELYQKTIERESILKSAGYTIVSIWESDFKKLLERQRLAA